LAQRRLPDQCLGFGSFGFWTDQDFFQNRLEIKLCHAWLSFFRQELMQKRVALPKKLILVFRFFRSARPEQENYSLLAKPETIKNMWI
jgi:hypothetical protein